MSAATDPAFSVILPICADAALDRGTVASVLAQDERDLELLICGLPPEHDDPRIRVLGARGHRAALRDTALATARGRWVAYADNGNRWAPNHLTTLRGLLQDARIAATAATRVGAGGAVRVRTSALDAVWHPELQLMGPLFEPGRVAHERDVVTAAGGWSRGTDGPDGWALWVALADRGERFATSLRHTATVTAVNTGSGSAAVVLGVLPDAAHAAAALAFLRLPAAQARLRALHVADVTAWLDGLHVAGDLVLPVGLTPAALPALVAHETPHDTLPPLATRPHPEGVQIVRPLPCVSPAHGARIEALTRAHFSGKLAWLRRALTAAQPQAYA